MTLSKSEKWWCDGTKILDLTQKQETLTSAQKVKDAQIATLKSEYKHGSLEVMDYLVQVSVFCKNYDD